MEDLNRLYFRQHWAYGSAHLRKIYNGRMNDEPRPTFFNKLGIKLAKRKASSWTRLRRLDDTPEPNEWEGCFRCETLEECVAAGECPRGLGAPFKSSVERPETKAGK